MIWKRPAPPDDHLQEACPSRWSTIATKNKKNKEGEEKEKGEEKKEKKFLRTGGHTDQSKVIQEVFMDLKLKKG